MSDIISAIADDEERYHEVCRRRGVRPREDFYPHLRELDLEDARDRALELLVGEVGPATAAALARPDVRVYAFSVGTGETYQYSGMIDDDGVYTQERMREVYVGGTSRRDAADNLAAAGVHAKPSDLCLASDPECIKHAWTAYPSVVIKRMHPEGPKECTYDYPHRFQPFSEHWLGRRLAEATKPVGEETKRRFDLTM